MVDRDQKAHDLTLLYLDKFASDAQTTPEELVSQYTDIYEKIKKALPEPDNRAKTWHF